MEKRLCLIGMAVASVIFAACVGDDPATSDGGGGTTLDGSAPPGDGGLNDGAPSDSATNMDSGADAAVLCGFPGEACCTGPFAPCNTGTTCTANVCAVTDLFVVGDYVDVSTFKHNAVSASYNGSVWTAGPNMGNDVEPTAVWGLAPGNYRAVTRKGKILLYSGGASPQWLVCGSFGCSDPMTTADLWGIYGFSSSDFWVGGTNVMFQCSNASCVSKTNGLPATWGQGTFTGTSSTDLWYPQFDKAFHYNGALWTVYPSIQARAMWAHRSNDVWGGDSTLQHFDGASWSAAYVIDGLPAPGIITAMSGTATDDVWAVGYKNNTDGSNVPFSARWNGTVWKLVPFPVGGEQVQTVWAASKKEAYAASFNGSIYKWNGTAWAAMTLPGTIHAGTGWASITGSARPRP